MYCQMVPHLFVTSRLILHGRNLTTFNMAPLREDVRHHVSTCPVCQKNKKQTKKYGHLPAKKAEGTPWECLCVDLIGEYKIK